MGTDSLYERPGDRADRFLTAKNYVKACIAAGQRPERYEHVIWPWTEFTWPLESF